jgi:hypothetical protein
MKDCISNSVVTVAGDTDSFGITEALNRGKIPT